MTPKIGIILGSGLNKFSEELSSTSLLYEDDSSFHSIKVLSGKIDKTEIVLFSGRRHFYEGYSQEKILENVGIAGKLGVNFLIITNAAGGLNTDFRVSDLMLITSHLNFLNKIFPAKSNKNYYDKGIIESVRNLSIQEKIILRFGSYCCTSGPMYETKSDIRFLAKCGIDAIGMSTIPEIMYASKLGIKTLAFSCITNLLTENSATITDHEDVIAAGENAYANFSGLIKKIIANSDKILN